MEEDLQRPSIEELSSMAANGDEPAQRLTASEWCLYYRLRDIYNKHRNGVPIEECRRLKAKAVAEFDQMATKERQADEMITRLGKFWLAVEEAGSRYGRERTIEAADVFFWTVYGLKGGIKID